MVPATERLRWAVVIGLALATAVAASPVSAQTKTWLLKAQHQLTCTSYADEAERAALGVRWVRNARAVSDTEMRELRNYVAGTGTRADERLFRYVSVLASFAYQANYSNDQWLRSRFDAAIMAHAAGAADLAAPNVMTQVLLCGYVHLLEAGIETDSLEQANSAAKRLAVSYMGLAPASGVTDWPLIQGLRAVAAAPVGLEAGMTDLVAAALHRALALEASDPRRASRLFGEAAMARHLMGESREAIVIGARSVMILPEAEKAAAAWRAYPAMYDAALVTGRTEPPTAGELTIGFFERYGFPEGLGDPEVDFAVYARLADFYRAEGRDYANFWVLAFMELMKLHDDVMSVQFLRSALRRLAASTDAPVDMLLTWRSNEPLPADSWQRARVLYDYLLEQRQRAMVTDTRTQLFMAFLSESILHSLGRLQPRDARAQQALHDLSFRVLQLDSFTRVSVAAASTGLKQLRMPREQLFHLERFYTYAAQHSAWVDKAGWPLVVGAGQPLPAAEQLWNAFMIISIFQNETTAELGRYYDVLREQAPGIAAMTIPYALPLADFQRALGPDQAIVATVLGSRESYVWAIRGHRVVFEPIERGAAEFAADVTALRASVLARDAGGRLELPPFDARAAFALYEATLGRVAAGLDGVRHLYWYGDGPLGAIPPAILVTQAPQGPQLATREQFAATQFLVDRYSLSSLPDLYLAKTAFLKPPRAAQARSSFAGFGAPLLSAEELAQETLAGSFELAGGMPVSDLRSLAKLPAARDELTALAGLFDESLVWLGAEADEARLKQMPLDGYRILAFATHGFTPADIEGQLYPSLLMAPPEQASGEHDGLLTTLEIGELNLDADLVLLSACNTATSDGRPDAEAFSGLVQSFLVAGARSLLVSHWPVASAAATQLSVPAVRRWLEGMPLAESLRQSIVEMRHAAQSDLEAHPFFWGPFVLADDGSSGLMAAP